MPKRHSAAAEARANTRTATVPLRSGIALPIRKSHQSNFRKDPHTLVVPRCEGRRRRARHTVFWSDRPSRGTSLRTARNMRRALRRYATAASGAYGRRRRRAFLYGFADSEIEFFEHASTNLSLKVGPIAYRGL